MVFRTRLPRFQILKMLKWIIWRTSLLGKLFFNSFRCVCIFSSDFSIFTTYFIFVLISSLCRLISVEEELRREHRKMSETVTHKQRVIEAHEHRIAALEATNSRLMSVLNQVQDRYQGSNNKLNPNQRLLEELGELKSSSCWKKKKNM